MHKTTFGILATAALLFTPIAAFADDQTSVQTGGNSAAAVGDGNAILQDSEQYSDQLQVDTDVYGYEHTDAPDSQLSVQGQTNEGAAIGDHNLLGQFGDQTNVQTQVDE